MHVCVFHHRTGKQDRVMNFYVDKLMELKEAQARNNEESEERKLQTKICRMENVLK